MGDTRDPFDPETPSDDVRFPTAEEATSGIFSTAPPPRPQTDPPPASPIPPPSHKGQKPYKTLQPPPAFSLRPLWDRLWKATAGRLFKRLTGRS